MTRRARAGLVGLAAVLLVACASTQKPAALTKAEGIYAALQTAHADQRVEGDVIRTRAALDTAQSAVSEGQNQDYADGVADIALRTAQTAEARFARAVARQATDSLQKVRLARMLAASQARQATLEAKQAALEREKAAAAARADSLAAIQAKLPAAVPSGGEGSTVAPVPDAAPLPDSSLRVTSPIVPDTTRRPAASVPPPSPSPSPSSPAPSH